MNTKIRSILAAASVLALSSIVANAQLVINPVTAFFNNPQIPGGAAFPNDPATQLQITNGGNSTTFSTGAPVQPVGSPGSPADSKTGTTFNNSVIPNITLSSFPISPAPTFDINLGTFSWINGRTNPGTSYLEGDFNFSFSLQSGPTVYNISRSTTITFDGTGVGTGLDGAGDKFIVNPIAGGSFVYGTQTYQYGFVVLDVNTGLDASNVSVDEGKTGATTLTLRVFAPVPEPSTYALSGVIALMGVVAVRRFRSSKKVVA